MLYQFNDYVWTSLKQDEARALQRAAEQQRILRAAGVLPHHALPRFLCRALSLLGKWLIVNGTRLAQFDPTPPAPSDLQIA